MQKSFGQNANILMLASRDNGTNTVPTVPRDNICHWEQVLATSPRKDPQVHIAETCETTPEESTIIHSAQNTLNKRERASSLRVNRSENNSNYCLQPEQVEMKSPEFRPVAVPS